MKMTFQEIKIIATGPCKTNHMKMLYRVSYIDASCQVWFHLAKEFQGRRPRAILVSDWLMLNKSSHLKLLGQIKPNLAGSIYVRYSIKFLHLVPFGQQTWPPEETS
jgi:hypothetical protein